MSFPMATLASFTLQFKPLNLFSWICFKLAVQPKCYDSLGRGHLFIYYIKVIVKSQMRASTKS